MSNRIHFTKMHGCGNDYIYVNTMEYAIEHPEEKSILWSDRHKGIGSDGLVLIGASPIQEADFSMRIFNADGSEAMMCGNACRCIGKYLYEKGLTKKTEIHLLTLSGIKILLLTIKDGQVERVTVDMLEPTLKDDKQFHPLPDLPEGYFVSMGNPHYVIFTDTTDDIEQIGRELEFHPAFPQRCNIELARITDKGSIRVRVWERGSGITMACGTGACAVAVAACLSGRTSNKSQIEMDGGTLEVEWRKTDNHVLLSGPAQIVFEGEILINS